jgi:hypothetical protein
MARDDGRFKVENHYLSAEDAARYQPGWSLTFYCILTPIAIFLITVLGLPILALLRKVRLTSVAGALGASTVFAIVLSYWVDSATAEDIGIWEVLTAGFVLAARLPWFISPKVPARESLGGAPNADQS